MTDRVSLIFGTMHRSVNTLFADKTLSPMQENRQTDNYLRFAGFAILTSLISAWAIYSSVSETLPGPSLSPVQLVSS